MNNNIKFSLIIFLGLVVPNSLIWYVSLNEYKFKGLYLNDYEGTILLLILFTLAGPAYVLYKNNSIGVKSKLWNLLSIILLVAGLIYLYIGYSLSSFGF